MTTERFLNRFAAQTGFIHLCEALRKSNARALATHLAGSAKSVLGAAAARKLGGLHLFICNERDEAAYLYNDVYNLLGERDVLFFPSSYRRSLAHGEEDSAAAIQRTTALAAMADTARRKHLVVVGYPESVAERVASGEALQRNTLVLHEGEKIAMEFVRDVLLEYKFERTDFVYEAGQFAIRGSLIDVFSYADNKPYRIDFFGNEVESVRSFNLNTQLSDEKRKEVEIVPNLREMSAEREQISLFDFIANTSADKRFDATVWVNDVSFVEEKIRAMLAAKGSGERDVAKLAIDAAALSSSLRAARTVLFNAPASGSWQGVQEFAFATAAQPAFNKNYEMLAAALVENEANGFQNLLLTESILQAERLDGILAGIASASSAAKRTGGLYEQLPLVLHEGFSCAESKLCCYTDHQLFSRYHRYKLHGAPEKSEQLTLQELNSLQVGDYVVHIDHGVGTFGGLVKQRINGKDCEFIKLTYRDGDVLMVSVHGLHRIARYRGRDGEPPKIYKLGSGAWQKLKNATKSKVKDIARDLIKLYAQRKETKGFAFSPDTYLQHELEASFIYEDTPDQLKTTQAVKADMEAEAPMDRLICGDVGFGKTEIAIRAAFKAVADSKQVAVLVPTTLLALQHHKTFSRRLRNLPCRTEYLSRFRSAADARAILDDLDAGKIDILIGTHKLLGKQVHFKNLGLLIIDEEQKFGVAAKEKLRQLRQNVDTLTLSATPIPRTLQFSLMGARDLSVIHTPPPNRQPVATEVHTFDENVIREAIENEVARGGQVFFVNNHVANLPDIEGLVRRLCPKVRTVSAHGQLEGSEMERRVIDFILGEYDVLIATSIVENGIDIPNANTIIINNAHQFGLSDLHQLRGRVGRSNRKAYCYLLAPPEGLLTGEARRRLRALEEFSDLGSGFNIAMQDLDIRGAGNLLGGEQSGFIAEMGFETYQRILNEAMVELQEDTPQPPEGGLSAAPSQPAGARGLELPPSGGGGVVGVFVSDCAIETDLEILIPDSYVSSIPEKIRLYREIDSLKTEDEIAAFSVQLTDRFGRIPPETEELLNVIRLRQAAIPLGIEKINLKNGLMVAYFVANPASPFYRSATFDRLMQRIAANAVRCKMKQDRGKLELVVRQVANVAQAMGAIALLI